MFLNSLSGRFLLLTVVFVMLAEVLIFVPSVARFREDYLQARLERGQIASLAVLATTDEMVHPELERELLKNAGVLNVVLRRNEVSELILSLPMPSPITNSYDLRTATPWILIRNAIIRLFKSQNEIVRIVGTPLNQAGLQIEVTMNTAQMRASMVDYGVRVLMLSLVISIFTAILLFLAVRRFLVSPINRVVSNIKAYEADPSDQSLIISPSASIVELNEAETALQSMQIQLSSALREKDRLATLGGAVAKISHDLRNMLTTAQLLADRMELSEDPAVKRTAPKLVGSLSRAVNLCESTLKFGKAEEPAPYLARFSLRLLLNDVIESERLTIDSDAVKFDLNVRDDMQVCADSEQIYRVLSNLLRNARQAIVATKRPGRVTVSATEEDSAWFISVSDTGPGLPDKAVQHLFDPFEGGVRVGGTGLGLAIAAELVRGHKGTLELTKSTKDGTTFTICLPKQVKPAISKSA